MTKLAKLLHKLMLYLITRDMTVRKWDFKEPCSHELKKSRLRHHLGFLLSPLTFVSSQFDPSASELRQCPKHTHTHLAKADIISQKYFAFYTCHAFDCLQLTDNAGSGVNPKTLACLTNWHAQIWRWVNFLARALFERWGIRTRKCMQTS